MGFKFYTFGKLHIEYAYIKASLCRNLGVKLAQRACGGISGIGKEGFSIRFLLGIQFLKTGLGQEHLAADNQPLRRAGKPHRHRANGFDIFRHIFTNITVTTGCTLCENTVNILK